jgi:hypothetical protein
VKTSVQEQYALLRYLLNHNSQHAEELHNLTHELDMKTADLIHTAVESYQEGNKKLEAALRRLKETE